MSERVSDGRCAWIEIGRGRCTEPGSMSFCTRGEGPWYCVHHLFRRDGLVPSTMQERIDAGLERDRKLREKAAAVHAAPEEFEEPGSGG